MKYKFLFLFVLLASVLVFINLNFGDKSFDREEWANNPSRRYKMTDDLIQSKKLKGKTKQEVIDLLTNDCKDFDVESDSWMYYTKIESGWRKANIEILDVIFREGKVHEISIRE